MPCYSPKKFSFFLLIVAILASAPTLTQAVKLCPYTLAITTVGIAHQIVCQRLPENSSTRRICIQAVLGLGGAAFIHGSYRAYQLATNKTPLAEQRLDDDDQEMDIDWAIDP